MSKLFENWLHVTLKTGVEFLFDLGAVTRIELDEFKVTISTGGEDEVSLGYGYVKCLDHNLTVVGENTPTAKLEEMISTIDIRVATARTVAERPIVDPDGA